MEFLINNIHTIIITLFIGVILQLLIKFINRKNKNIFKGIFCFVLMVYSFAIITTSIIFFYKYQQLKLLVPSIIGIIFLVFDFIVYVIFFEGEKYYG